MREMVNAVLLHADWRPLAGLGPDDAGTLVERALASAVIEAATEQHNILVKAK